MRRRILMVLTIKRFEAECSESVGSIALNCETKFLINHSLSSDRNVKYAAAVMKAYMAFNCVMRPSIPRLKKVWRVKFARWENQVLWSSLPPRHQMNGIGAWRAGMVGRFAGGAKFRWFFFRCFAFHLCYDLYEMAKFKNKWSRPFAESLLECERQLKFMQYR